MNCSHNSLKDHLECALNFLHDHQWIYNYPNTHILIEKVFNNFHSEWIPYLKNISNDDLNDIPYGIINDAWPTSLKTLLQEIKELKCKISEFKATSELCSLPRNIRVSEKKHHEIVYLAAAVNDICKGNNASVVIDIGSGLGYLSQLLYEKYKLKVLGIEGNKIYFNSSLKNQEKWYPHSKDCVKYAHHFITENSLSDLENLLKSNFPEWDEKTDSVCIAGLHACADLSVTILKIFAELDFAKTLIVMPCCYHRLTLQSSSMHEERFECFPASESLRTAYCAFKGDAFLRRPFLRLACQQSSNLWRSMSESAHQRHARDCIFRAILQEVADQENLDVRRLKRKTGKLTQNADCSMQDYMNNLKSTHELVAKVGASAEGKALIDDAAIKSKMLEKWNEYKESCYLIEVLMAFQAAIQSICEDVVLLDRVEFLRERGLRCDMYKVADDRISPRCHALIARKPQP